MTRRLWLVLTALVCLLALPAVAHAQSAIAGVVKDSSGAVLPGVTVEAASPALIEKSKVVVTDGSGAYKIIDLRPGTYLITFTLTGFQTYKREGLELPSDFTANVDASMKVGALEESVIVTGASPVVDVQSNVKSQVLSRETLDAVPNAHTIQSVGQLIPGVTLTSPDVAGSAQMQQTYFSVHGSGAAGTSLAMDGMIINGLQGDGAIQTYMNDASAQEMVYRTGGGGGEQQTGGLQINVVPREGGNRFSGSFQVNYENWQSDNFTDELKALGVTSVDKLGTYHDVTASMGGPVKKDRLWFFGSGRISKEDKPVASTTNSASFSTPLTDPTNVAQSVAILAACRAAGTACPQGSSPEVINSGLARLTLQLNSKNKVSAYLDRIHKDRASAMGARDDQRITGVHWTSPLYMTNTVKWTSTVSSRLLFQGGWSSNLERYNNSYQPGIEQPAYTSLWYAMASRVYDATNRSVAGGTEVGSYPDRYNMQASASYVTGSHNVSVGFQDSFGVYNNSRYANADLTENFTTNAATGIANASTVTVQASAPWWADKLNGALGIYAQDNWTMKRLTVNYGARWDRLSESVLGQPVNTGTFAYILPYADKKMPIQTNWEPHVSVIFDLFGSGKTALRAGFNRYVNGATTGLASANDPGSNPTLSPNWTDVNGDGIAQYQVTHNATTGALQMPCTYSTLGCEVNFAGATGVSTYGNTVSNNVQDPDLKRPYQEKFNVGVSHELFRGVSVSAEWFRTNDKDIQQTFDISRMQPCGGVTAANGLSAADMLSLVNCNKGLSASQIANNSNFRLVNVYSPVDGHVVPIYDYSSAAVNSLGAVNFVTTDPDQSNTYTGFDLGVNARLPRGGRVFGGTTTERTISNDCDTAITTPSNLLFCDRGNLGGGYSIPWKTQIKVAGSYPLPFFGIIVNGSYQGLPGYTLTATTYGSTATNVRSTTSYVTCPGSPAGCVVGQPLIPGQFATSRTVTLDPGGTTLTPRNNQVDFGLAKRMKFGRLRVDPKVDLFNALNSSDYYSVTTSGFSPRLDPSVPAGTAATSSALPSLNTGGTPTTYHQPARFLQGRIVRLGVNVTW